MRRLIARYSRSCTIPTWFYDFVSSLTSMINQKVISANDHIENGIYALVEVDRLTLNGYAQCYNVCQQGQLEIESGSSFTWHSAYFPPKQYSKDIYGTNGNIVCVCPLGRLKERIYLSADDPQLSDIRLRLVERIEKLLPSNMFAVVE